MVLLVEELFNIQNILETNKFVLIDFTATWCGPCQRIAPIFEELSKKYTSVKFIKIDVDNVDTKAFCSMCEVSSMPTFILIKNGGIFKKMIGASKEQLEHLLEFALNS